MNRKNRNAANSAKKHPVLVKNYGLYWNRELVDWKRRFLKGSRLKRGKSINFWQQSGIYVLYSTDNQPIYFGQAGTRSLSKLGTRLKQHTSDNLADLWDKFSWYGFQAVNKSRYDSAIDLRKPGSQHVDIHREVDLIEAILISILPSSLRNKQDGKWKKINAHRYHQELNEAILRKNNKEYGAFKSLEEKVESLTKTLQVLVKR